MNQAITRKNQGSTMGSTARGSVRGKDRARVPSADEVLGVPHGGNVIRNIFAGKRQLRVLVADDHRDGADSLGMLLTLWGYEARVAYDGAAALQVASTYQPHVLLLELATPRMIGCHLARQLRRQARFQDALLIAITGSADETRRRLCEEAGFDLLLIKPVEPLTLEVLLLLEQGRLSDLPEAAVVTPGNEFHRDSAIHRGVAQVEDTAAGTGD